MNKLIVLVEDNRSDIFLIRQALLHHTVPVDLVCYEDVPCATKGLLENAGRLPDGILMDMNLTCGDATDLLEFLRSRELFAKVPVAVLTSSQSAKDEARAAAYGVMEFVNKPATLTEFYRVVASTVRNLVTQ